MNSTLIPLVEFMYLVLAFGGFSNLLYLSGCLSFTGSGQNHLARRSERGKKTRQTEKEVGRQHQGMDRPEFAKSKSTVEDREKWRKLVLKSSVVPQRPSRLRDR